MSASAYFDSSVFLDIFSDAPTAPGIRALVRELRRDKIRIYTSIITIQEVSVLPFRAGKIYDDNHGKINRLSRIQTITREIALTAAKIEAQILDLTPTRDQVENRRRKWDCFHIATAMQLGCSRLYTTDSKMRARQASLSILGIAFLEPLPQGLELFGTSEEEERIQ